MSVLKRCLKIMLERFCGVVICRYDNRYDSSRTFHIIDKRKLKDAWFSNITITKSIIEELQVDLVIDVGANRGQSVQRIRSFYKGLIISFEPVSSLYRILEEAASCDQNWFVFNYALGNQSKEQNINRAEFDVFSSMAETTEYCVEHFGETSAGITKEMIRICRFDDIKDELPFEINDKRILLKMDTQGYDLEVFRGASSILENVVALQSEVSQVALYQGAPHWTESINEYEKAGFRLAGLYPVNKDGFQFIECDCLMVKQQSEGHFK